MSLPFLQAAVLNANVQAFMTTISQSEGAQYNSLFGDTPNGKNTFDDYSKHPNVHVPFGKDNYSDAAGRYQIMFKTYTAVAEKYGFTDFEPQTQDLICAELISERDCLQRLMDGDFYYAVERCNNIWASLPGSPYGQPVHDLETVAGWYVAANGTINDTQGVA